MYVHGKAYYDGEVDAYDDEVVVLYCCEGDDNDDI
jgi:hypothetical protein